MEGDYVPKNIVEWPPKIKKITPVLVLQKSTGNRFKKLFLKRFMIRSTLQPVHLSQTKTITQPSQLLTVHN
jgi:hypothetical protein